jgi:hypothetical protein
VPKCAGVSTFIFFIREVSVVGRWVIALAPMNSFPIRRGCTRHTTKRFGEVTLIGKTVLYRDVGEGVTAVE